MGLRDEATEELLSGQNPDGSWGYRPGLEGRAEPTALGALALQALDASAEAVSSAVGWLESQQRPDGAIPASQATPQSTWSTGLGLLGLLKCGGSAGAVQAAIDWLLDADVYRLLSPARSLLGYDTTLVGWAWTDRDFSFVEPTAHALIALKQSSAAGDGRVQAGNELLRDRIVAAGGWNFGEPEVLGHALPPIIMPTAAALLAMQDVRDAGTSAGLAFLQSQAGDLSATWSLGWVIQALIAYEAADEATVARVHDVWVASHPDRRGLADAALALLTLAGKERNPFVF